MPERLVYMNIAEAFEELKSNNPALNGITSIPDIRQELAKAGYIESWSKVATPDLGVKSDGTNTPAVPVEPSSTSQATEKALLKQAENPLGDPNKV